MNSRHLPWVWDVSGPFCFTTGALPVTDHPQSCCVWDPLEGSMHRTEQVWLPELQVWAAKPSLPLPPRSNSSSRPPQPIVLCDSVSPGSSEPSADLEHVAQVVAGRNREVIDVTSPSCSPQPGSSPASALQAPSCPICEFPESAGSAAGQHLQLLLNPFAGLSDIQNPLDKAVGLPCLHVFCTPCLGTWTHRHRSCPLCKVQARRPAQQPFTWSILVVRADVARLAGHPHIVHAPDQEQHRIQRVGAGAPATARPCSPA